MGGQANTGSLFGFTNVKGSLQNVVSPNITAGFSISSFTGTGSTQTIGHGLNNTPELVIAKRRDNISDWFMYSKELPDASYYLYLNSTAAQATHNPFWNSTPPTSSVVTIGSDFISSASYLAYCFHSVEGYSKFGSYTGVPNADGPYIYTGFRPAWLMAKRTDSANSWVILDNKRNTSNAVTNYLQPNASDAEGTSGLDVDFTSNGFKWRTTSAAVNANGGTFIYMAIAENPFVTSTGKPVTAR
jgi:hypothetical protein